MNPANYPAIIVSQAEEIAQLRDTNQALEAQVARLQAEILSAKPVDENEAIPAPEAQDHG